jgi:hypothetical protein
MLYYMICNMLTFMCRQAGHLPPLNADDASMFTASECIIQDLVRKYKTKAAELKDLIQEVLHHPDFDVREVDTNMHECLMRCLAAGDTEVIYLWEEGDGNQPVQLYKRHGMKVLWELLADKTFQLAQIDVGPGEMPISIVLYIDGTFIKRSIPIRPIYCKFITCYVNVLHIILYITCCITYYARYNITSYITSYMTLYT